MTTNFKPGEIALLISRYDDAPTIGFCYQGGPVGEARFRTAANPEGVWSSVKEIRPLLAIDPEDDEQIRALASAYTDRSVNPTVTAVPELATERLRNAVRALLRPEPDEPTGLGAVVRDGEGRLQVRSDDETYPWYDGGDGWRWSDLPRPLAVLHEGYTGDES